MRLTTTRSKVAVSGRVSHMTVVAETTEARFVARSTGEVEVEQGDGRRQRLRFDASGQTDLWPSIRFVHPQHGSALTSRLYITSDGGVSREPVRFERYRAGPSGFPQGGGADRRRDAP